MHHPGAGGPSTRESSCFERTCILQLIAFLYSPAGSGAGETDALAGADSLWRGSGSDADDDDDDDVEIHFPTLELPPFPADMRHVVDDAALRNARMILAEEIEEDI